MTDNTLKRLCALGQSLWLDEIGRDLILSGQLNRLMESDGIRGLTSNPTLFEQAIAQTSTYEQDIADLASSGHGAQASYEILALGDAQNAADELRPWYDLSGGDEGFVSLEINPHLAMLADATVDEGRRLWKALDRPNVLIKVPATDAGILASKHLLREGINVNITMIFGLTRYQQAVDAYLEAMEIRVAHGERIHHVTSVAAFFVSRIDSLVDPWLQSVVSRGGKHGNLAKTLLGQIGVSSAKLAFQRHQAILAQSRCAALSEHGGRCQKLLWASTTTKNHCYSKVKYMEALIGPGTISSVGLCTLEAYRKIGDPQIRLESDIKEALWVMERLPELGIVIQDAIQQLEREALEKLNAPFDKLMRTLTKFSPRFL